MSAASVAVLLMAPSSEPELERLLGHGRLAELRALLLSQAQEWARAFAREVRRARENEALSAAVERMFAEREGPLLVVWPWLPQVRPEHAAGALEDLDEGCDVVFGPVIDGGLYLLGLTRPISALPVLPSEGWQEPDVMTTAFAAAGEAGLEVGILRAERGLRRPADVRALLADPLLSEAVRRILAGAG